MTTASLSSTSEYATQRSSEIHELYTEEVDDPRTKRTVRYLSKMIQCNLVDVEGTSRDREYSPVSSEAASPMQ